MVEEAGVEGAEEVVDEAVEDTVEVDSEDVAMAAAEVKIINNRIFADNSYFLH